MEIGVGLLGGGTVGGELAKRLLEDHAAILAKSGIDLRLRGVAVRELDKPRLFPSRYIVDRPEVLVSMPEVDLVVELMGGVDPARELVLSALDLGKPVITANKELLSLHGPELFARAADKGVSLLFEAAVGGGIPLIRPLSESLAGEKIERVTGIVNGTTNYILTAMDSDGMAYREALASAQQLGYAEADPTADVSGGDAAAKAAILAGLAFGQWVNITRVYREGITELSTVDMKFAHQLGYGVKLLAVADTSSQGPAVRVHPALVPTGHPLALIRGANNGVFLEGPSIGELLFLGPGAGGRPTATAVLGDVILASREFLAGTKVAPRVRFGNGAVRDFSEVETQWYLRLEVRDAPGVLAQIASVFGAHQVSIRSVWQEGRGDGATLLLVTHHAREDRHRAAARDLEKLEVVRQVAATIRVIGTGP
ncbi:MAG: homoserine dehydrogenase [Actinomycetia bacterium]|nr:homoserine dehydrogenase [Actinomycetes bacterium]